MICDRWCEGNVIWKVGRINPFSLLPHFFLLEVKIYMNRKVFINLHDLIWIPGMFTPGSQPFTTAFANKFGIPNPRSYIYGVRLIRK